MSDSGTKMVRLAPNGTNPGRKIRFKYKCTFEQCEPISTENHEFVTFGVKLAHFGSKSDIPVCMCVRTIHLKFENETRNRKKSRQSIKFIHVY